MSCQQVLMSDSVSENGAMILFSNSIYSLLLRLQTFQHVSLLSVLSLEGLH